MAISSLLMILLILIVLLVLGVPISYAIGVSSLAVILKTVPIDVSVLTAAQRTFVGMSKFTLTAIPFFILAGNLMNQGGIAKRLVDFVMALLGRVPGALLVTNCGANALFGAISGSGSAAAAAVGSMLKEGQEEQHYDEGLCAATNGASAPSGLLIPPSNTLITFSLASGGTSVAALFLAGYVPGLVWTLCCIFVAIIYARKRGYKGAGGKYDWKNLGRCTLRALPSLSPDHRRYRRYRSRCFHGDRGIRDRCCVCAGPGNHLQEHHTEVLLEDRCGFRQNERHGRLPDRCVEHPGMGHGVPADPAGCFCSTAGSEQ